MGRMGNAEKATIIAAIITAIAGIIGTVLNVFVPIARENMQATQTKEAQGITLTAVAAVSIEKAASPTPEIPATGIATPTPTPQPPVPQPPRVTPTLTVTASPTPVTPTATETQVSASSAATPLRIKESVTGNGLTVRLDRVILTPEDEIHLCFVFTNETKPVMHLSFDHNRDVTVTDDQGKVYTWAKAYLWEPELYTGIGQTDKVFLKGNASQVRYFIVTLNLPGYLSAQWQVEPPGKP